MKQYTFKKEERLCNKRLLGQLFQSGSFFMRYPFRVGYLLHEGLGAPAQVVIAVPKKRFKRAVDRNLLKRRMREAYRLQKENLLYQDLRQHYPEKGVLVSLQYIGKEIHDYAYIVSKMHDVLIQLTHELRQIPDAKVD